MRCTSWADATSRDAKRMSLLVDLERGFTSLSRGRPRSSRPPTYWGAVPRAQTPSATMSNRNAFQAGPCARRRRSACGAGVGILRGLETISAEGQPDRDMLRVEFADEASVLMPVQETASLWRYGAIAKASRWTKPTAVVASAPRPDPAGHLGDGVEARRTREGARKDLRQNRRAGGGISAVRLGLPISHHARSSSGDRGRASGPGLRASHGPADLRRCRLRQD